MPGRTPSRDYIPLPFGRCLDEAQSPSKVGAEGLTVANNVIYRRFGSWGKRPGSSLAYVGGVGPNSAFQPSAYRFYAAKPSILTRTVVGSGGYLWVANDPGSAFTQVAGFTQYAAGPLGFCTAYDPAANAGVGADVLIITGGQLATGSYAVGEILYSSKSVTTSTVVTVTMIGPGGSPTVTVSYTSLATDNTASVASALVALINTSTAVTGATAFLAPAYTVAQDIPDGFINAQIFFGAQVGGAAGNSISISTTISNGSITDQVVGMAGGGAQFAGPLKYDGKTLTGLSPFIPNTFTGCCSWHNHVWFWGDPANPITLFATDINTPEGFSFMAQEGGYDIGDGSGGQAITCAIPIGNILYVFNSSSSYAVSGYDFQSGEYQFSVEPAISDSGVAYKECVTQLRNSLLYWDGAAVHRLVPGALETERLTLPIPFTAGLVANGKQNLIRATAGSFAMESTFGTTYTAAPTVLQSPMQFTNVAMFAVDVGNGVADTILVYDEEKSRLDDLPAWSVWTGMQIGAWLKFGSSGNAAATGNDMPSLYAVTPTNPFDVNLIGGNPTQDASGAVISFTAQTGWFDLGTPQLPKLLHHLYLDVEARPGLNLTGTLIAAGPMDGTQVIVYGSVPITFPTTVGQGLNPTSQQLIAKINPALRGYKFMLILNDAGSVDGFELVGALCDVQTEPFTS